LLLILAINEKEIEKAKKKAKKEAKEKRVVKSSSFNLNASLVDQIR